MEGIFKGWNANKPFGFIRPNDGSEDIFVPQVKVRKPRSLRAGARVSFELEMGLKGKNIAVNVVAIDSSVVTLKPERHRGRVKFWNDRGYGFIAPEDGGADVYMHDTATRLDSTEYVSEGDLVEYQVAEGEKGLEAGAVSVVGWFAPQDHLARFADMGPSGWLADLVEKAEKEPWEYTQAKAAEPLPILRSYVRHTFRRVEEMDGGIGYSADSGFAAFNTGLVTPNQEEIFALFDKNPRPDRQPWRLLGFQKASERQFLNLFGAALPPMANYFDDPSELLYDRRCELFISIDHVMENIDRFPPHLQANQYVARQLLISAEATTKKRVYRNYKAAVPQFYRDKGGAGSVQLLMPICLENPAKADLALVVGKTESGSAYRGSTVLTLDMAYNNARLLARPDSEWLQP